MTRKVSEFLAEIADREAIRDCMYRYARGMDRLDADLVLSCLWPDFTDQHSGHFFASPQSFIDGAFQIMRAMPRTQHLLGNILIDIQGAIARVESYVQAYHRLEEASESPHDLVTAGRYVDRFEKRDDEWRIARRVVIRDWFRIFPDSADWEKGVMGVSVKGGAKKPEDPSYQLLQRDNELHT